MVTFELKYVLRTKPKNVYSYTFWKVNRFTIHRNYEIILSIYVVLN
jgi:hypothetical protein